MSASSTFTRGSSGGVGGSVGVGGSGGAGGADGTGCSSGNEAFTRFMSCTSAARLEKEKQNAEKQLAGVLARLNNKAFTDKAPAAVVAGAQAQADSLREKLALLEQSMQQMR